MRPTARAQNQLAMNDLPRCLKTCIALATGANHKMPSCEGKKELWRRDHTLRPWAVQAASWCAQTWQAQWSSSSVPPHGRPVVRASFNMIFYGVSRNQRWRPVRWLGRPQSQGTIHRKPVCKSGHVSRAGPWPGTAPVSPLPSPKAGPCSAKRAERSRLAGVLASQLAGPGRRARIPIGVKVYTASPRWL